MASNFTGRDGQGLAWQWFKSNWRKELHKRDHYFSGKGFQKFGTLCHMLASFKGRDHQDTTECASTLKEAFECMYDRTVSDGSDRKLNNDNEESLQEEGCWWSPFGSRYDEDWGGIPSRWDDSPICGLDFGNSCYNDHHYHWGYYVVSAAMVADLVPSLTRSKFVEFVEMFIRDVGNPSEEDTYFPQFRAFDWFDMHSWSRGLVMHPNGKDQESTSEEVNFHYGMKLWGDVTERRHRKFEDDPVGFDYAGRLCDGLARIFPDEARQPQSSIQLRKEPCDRHLLPKPGGVVHMVRPED